MMNHIRIRRLSAIGICFLILLGLTACSITSIIPSKSSGTPAPTGESIPKVSILLVYDTNEIARLQDALPRINDAVNNLVFHDLGFQASLTLMDQLEFFPNAEKILTSGEYDLFSDGYGALQRYVREGKVLDMTPYLEGEGASVLSTYEFPELVTAFKINDALYGLPVHTASACGPAVLFNKEVLEEYGLDASQIKTFEDVEALYEEAAASEPGMYLTQVSLMDLYGYPPLPFDFLVTRSGGLNMLAALTGDIENETAVRCLHETDEYWEWAETLYRWDSKHWLYPDSLTSMNHTSELLGSREVFSLFITQYNPFELSDYEGYCGSKLVAVPLSDTVITTAQRSVLPYWMVAASSKYPDCAVRLLEYMNTSGDMMNLLSWGQENVDYIIGDYGLLDYPSGNTSGIWHFNNGGWLPNQYLLTPWADQDPYVYEEMQRINRTALRSKLLGFGPDTFPFDQEMEDCWEVLKKYQDEAAGRAIDPYNELPKMVDEMYDRKLGRVISEIQRQADEFLEEKEKGYGVSPEQEQ